MQSNVPGPGQRFSFHLADLGRCDELRAAMRHFGVLFLGKICSKHFAFTCRRFNLVWPPFLPLTLALRESTAPCVLP